MFCGGWVWGIWWCGLGIIWCGLGFPAWVFGDAAWVVRLRYVGGLAGLLGVGYLVFGFGVFCDWVYGILWLGFGILWARVRIFLACAVP